MINVSIRGKSVLGLPQPNANCMSNVNYKDVSSLLKFLGGGEVGEEDATL